nr:MAG TPA: hypothetical protein [Caudoviricetes sp.]
MLTLLYKVIDSLYNTGFYAIEIYTGLAPLKVMLTVLTSPLFI